MFLQRVLCAAALCAAAPLLAGCNTTGSLKSVEARCTSQYHKYSDAWNCVRNQTNVADDDYRTRYIATGDSLAAAVNAGQISDAEARSEMSWGFSSRGGGSGRR